MVRKNELEMLLLCCESALKHVISEKPNGGVITDKGRHNETRMKYREALKALCKLGTYFGLRGAGNTHSFGICMDCTSWSTKGQTSIENCCGSCKGGGRAKNYHPDTLHAYDSCDRHSKEGGGNGLE